jgi:hypothetical protein
MNTRQYIVLTLCLVMGLLLFTHAHAIIRRHDVEDSEYVVEASDYPAIVDLLGPGDCIATLIASQWLITAAHCAEHLPSNATLTIGGASYSVSATEAHMGWNDDTDDIALVQLSEAVPDVQPIPIYRDSDEVGQLIWFVGRGDTNTGLEGQSGAKVDGKTRKASNRIVDADGWWLMFVFNSPDDAEVTDLEGISGDGDSGGPALLERDDGVWVVGLSSFQDEGSHALGTYGVEEFYTRVSKYAGWVDAYVRPEAPDDDHGSADGSDDGGGSNESDETPDDTGTAETEESSGADGSAEQGGSSDATSSSGGGGCSAAGSGTSIPGWWMMLAALLFFHRFRFRRQFGFSQGG